FCGTFPMLSELPPAAGLRTRSSAPAAPFMAELRSTGPDAVAVFSARGAVSPARSALADSCVGPLFAGGAFGVGAAGGSASGFKVVVSGVDGGRAAMASLVTLGEAVTDDAVGAGMAVATTLFDGEFGRKNRIPAAATAPTAITPKT